MTCYDTHNLLHKNTGNLFSFRTKENAWIKIHIYIYIEGGGRARESETARESNMQNNILLFEKSR